MANMYGMVLARYKLCPEVKKTGLSGSTPLAAFVSSDVSKELSVLCLISGHTHQSPEGLIQKFHNAIVHVNGTLTQLVNGYIIYKNLLTTLQDSFSSTLFVMLFCICLYQILILVEYLAWQLCICTYQVLTKPLH